VSRPSPGTGHNAPMPAVLGASRWTSGGAPRASAPGASSTAISADPWCRSPSSSTVTAGSCPRTPTKLASGPRSATFGGLRQPAWHGLAPSEDMSGPAGLRWGQPGQPVPARADRPPPARAGPHAAASHGGRWGRPPLAAGRVRLPEERDDSWLRNASLVMWFFKWPASPDTHVRHLLYSARPAFRRASTCSPTRAGSGSTSCSSPDRTRLHADQHRSDMFRVRPLHDRVRLRMLEHLE
jgi:hypothetical protein